MKINEIGMLDFGKFHNKTIKLNSGINLIYGNNESGKSTTFSFISGMLYGFSKDSKKRRLYDDNKEKYRPWNSESYKGYLEISKNDDFRIERDFNSEELKFINLTKGSDISNIEELNIYSKVKQPGAYLLNMNKDLFLNTFFVGQLSTKIEDSAYESLKSKISNVSNTSDESLNIERACEILENNIKSLGKESRKNSEIGALANEIKDIKDKIYNLKDIKEDYDNALIKKAKLNEEISSLLEKKVRYEKIEEQKTYNQVLEKEKEVEEIKNHEKNIDFKDYERVLEIEKEIYYIDEEVENLNKKLISINNESINNNYKELEEDYEEIHKINERLRELDSINYSKEMEFLSVDITGTKGKGIKITSLVLGAFAIILIILFVSIYFKIYFLNLLSLIPVIYLYIIINNYRVNKELISRLDERMEELKKKSFEKTAEKKVFDKEINILLDKYNFENKLELEKYLREEVKNKTIESYQKEIDLKKIKNIKDKIAENINVKKKKLNLELEEIANKYGVLDINNLKDFFIKNTSSSDSEKIEYINNYIIFMLKGRNKENLNHNIKVEEVNKKELLESIKVKELEEAALKEKLSILEIDIKKLEDLMEDLTYKENKLNELVYKKDKTEIALSNILELLGDTRNNILPLLMKSMNNIISEITNKKYSEILIDKSFNIKIKDEEINSYVDLNSLSSGTIDQVYFSFRLSMIMILEENLPIILDDHFLQYDDIRLKNTIKYLNTLKNDRQIIIFSATNREKDTLENLNIEYNFLDMRCI